VTDASPAGIQGFSRVTPETFVSRQRCAIKGFASTEATKDFPGRKSIVTTRATSATEVHVPNHPIAAGHFSLRESAMAHADAGYHLIPLKRREKARRTRKGTQASSDYTVVRRWWTNMRDANIGVVLDLLMVVVIDVDGPMGAASLAWLLAQAGLDSLPATYTVTTGRPDGGRHYWFRLPSGAVKLFNQIGGPKSPTPGLDILFQGVAVAAGSVHKSGAVYRGNMTHMPEPLALTELPMALYQVLARRGRPKVAVLASRPPRQRQPSVGEAASAASIGASPLVIPPHVKRWLADGSNGRNDRTFKVVTGLIHVGADDQAIISTVLASVLGDKARQQVNPQAYLQQKIDSARQYVPVVLDRAAFWVAVHTSGMSAGKVRLLDALLARATGSGFVCISQVWMGIGSAVSSPGGVVHTLIQEGWLVVLRAASIDGPTSYRLSIPDVGDEKNHLQVCPSPSPLSQWGSYVRFPVHHDAFRCKVGSLHAAYPLLTLLGSEAQAMETLAGWLQVTLRTLRDRARSLTSAGLAVLSEGGLVLTGDPLLPLLDALAVKVGTDGYRLLAIESYYANADAWRKARSLWGEVGSPTWRKRLHARVVAKMGEGDLAALVEHLHGDVDAAATYMVEQEVLMLSADPETRTNGLAMLAAGLRAGAR
jgi:Bifunctional DNA primase/polymerase, N-terminal